MSKYPMGNFGKSILNHDELEAKAKEIRIKHPDLWSVKKLSKELHISTGEASRFYHKIIKGAD